MNDKSLFLPIQIRFNDIDPWGHVNNAVYQNYFDLGRMQFFDTTFGESWIKRESGLIIARTETDFLAPVFLNDSVGVVTSLKRLGNKSLTLQHELIDQNTKEVKVRSLAVMVCMDYEAGESIIIPNDWREVLEESSFLS